MFGKAFASMYTGSMIGAGGTVFAVWGYVIANANKSTIELNPKLLTHVIGEPVEHIEAAIHKLTLPDPDSRNKEDNGCRLVKEGQFQYRIPSWQHYHDIKNADDRREYNRMKKAESRAKKKAEAEAPSPPWK